MSADTALSQSAKAVRIRRMVGDDHANERHADDFYPTPPAGTEALLRVEQFQGPIWECACGDGAISAVLECSGYEVVSTDLVDRNYGIPRVDFLMESRLLAPNIITNPPFKLAAEFARHALALGTIKLALLCRMTFLEGMDRRRLFDSHPPSRIYAFSKRLTFHSGCRRSNPRRRHALFWLVHLGPRPYGQADSWVDLMLLRSGMQERG